MNPWDTEVSLADTVLISAADSGSLRRVKARLQGRPFDWAYLGQGVDSFHRVGQVFQGSGEPIDTSPEFHRVAEELREPYLAYLYDLGRELDSLRWWISTLSCRSGYTSKTFHQACYLRVALDLKEHRDGDRILVLVVEDRPVRQSIGRNLSAPERKRVRFVGPLHDKPLQLLRDAVRMLAHRSNFFLRQGYRISRSRRLVPRPHKPEQNTTIILSWAIPTTLSMGGAFHKSFFGDLASRLAEMGHQIAITPLIPPAVNYTEALSRTRDGSFPLMVPHRYLSYRDVVSTLIASLRQAPVPTGKKLRFAGMDIGPLVKYELRQDWVHNQAADSLLMAAVVRRWAAQGDQISRIIYVFENQSWERALCWQAGRSLPETTLVGYQHARVPRLMLNWFLAPGEEKDAPLPDRLVTVGHHSAHVLTSGGHGPERLRVGGALQMERPDGLSSRDGVAARQGDPTVLVVCSVGREETAELAITAKELFDPGEGVRVVLKCHPLMPFEQVSGLVGPQLPEHVLLSDEPLSDLMLNSSVLVYSGSTVCVQAMALGLPAVHLRTRFDLDLDPLDAVPEARIEARGTEELREQVRWLLDHREEYISQHKKAWDRLVGDIYGPVTPETYHAFVN